MFLEAGDLVSFVAFTKHSTDLTRIALNTGLETMTFCVNELALL